MKTVLGIETSCDETAVAIVSGEKGAPPQIRANLVYSQISEHAPYGGVVPEIAARAHVEVLDDIVLAALKEAGTRFQDLDGVAATAGPGLLGGLLVGLLTGKAIATVHALPFIAVNHLEGHALSVQLSEPVVFPFLLLLVSGGHCQLLAVEGPGAYRRYGSTIDDAAGEAFDKTAKALGLGYPGGPAVEALASQGNETAIALPRPLFGRPGADFSFAGLKTAVLKAHGALPGSDPDDKAIADLAASFQAAVRDVLVDRSKNAMALFREHFLQEKLETKTQPPHFVVAGGVAANKALRAALEGLSKDQGFQFAAPPLGLCTDNGAMIAYAGLTRLHHGMIDDVSAPARVRWPLDESRAGSGLPHKTGRKGYKA